MKKNLFVVLFTLLTASPVWLAGSGAGLGAGEDRNLRVVTCGKAHFLILDALYMFPEAADSVVAFGENIQLGGNFISLLDPGAKQRAVLAPDPGVEEILAFKPDTVVLKGYLKDGLGRRLEQLNVSVLYLDLENPEQFFRDVSLIGRLFQNPSRADALTRFFSRKLEEVKGLTREIPEAEKPDVLLLYYAERGGTASFNVPPKQWLQTGLVSWAGGRPVWSEAVAGSGWQQVSFEQIAAWNPDHVLLVSYHKPSDEVKSELLSDPKWMQLEAVSRGNLSAFPADFLSWDQPDPRWLLCLQWLAGRFHPQLFDPEAMEGSVVEFYSFVYGLSQQRIRESILPLIRGDYP